MHVRAPPDDAVADAPRIFGIPRDDDGVDAAGGDGLAAPLHEVADDGSDGREDVRPTNLGNKHVRRVRWDMRPSGRDARPS